MINLTFQLKVTVKIAFICVEGLISKNLLARGRLCGGVVESG